MDKTGPPESASPQKQTSKHSVRQPVSCEPCRRRKIKCSRTRPPCDTCRRRGCADHCVYKGSRDEAIPLALNPSNKELLDRISNLESLLRKHTGPQISAAQAESTSPMLSPPMEAQPFHLSPVSFTPESHSHASFPSARVGSRGVGVLTASPNGNVRYEPRSSQWTSVLANTGISIVTPSLEDQDDLGISSGFPFVSSSISSMDELLSILPPIQQCDYLKNIYFTVFSPVITLLPIDLAQFADIREAFSYSA